MIRTQPNSVLKLFLLYYLHILDTINFVGSNIFWIIIGWKWEYALSEKISPHYAVHKEREAQKEAISADIDFMIHIINAWLGFMTPKIPFYFIMIGR